MEEVGERPRGAAAREISAAAVEESGGDGDGERKKESGGRANGYGREGAGEGYRRVQAADRGEKFRIRESGVQNVKFFGGELFALFTPMFSYILQKDDPESKIILQNRGTKHGLRLLTTH